MSRFAFLTQTSGVEQVQQEQGSATAARRRLADSDDQPDPIGAHERDFISSLDGFYLATVSEQGWPYIQYKGGPAGFVHVVDPHTLALADVRGNRQYLSTGNLRGDDRVALFFMDYAARTRLKALGRAETVAVEDDPDLAAAVGSTRTDGHVERILRIHVEGLAWNCPKHITQRFTLDELQLAVGHLNDRIEQLERENLRLRGAASLDRPAS